MIISYPSTDDQIHNTGAALSSFGMSASSNGGPTVQSAVGTYCTGFPSLLFFIVVVIVVVVIVVMIVVTISASSNGGPTKQCATGI